MPSCPFVCARGRTLTQKCESPFSKIFDRSPLKSIACFICSGEWQWPTLHPSLPALLLAACPPSPPIPPSLPLRPPSTNTSPRSSSSTAPPAIAPAKSPPSRCSTYADVKKRAEQIAQSPPIASCRLGKASKGTAASSASAD